jgi:hypothetical protein
MANVESRRAAALFTGAYLAIWALAGVVALRTGPAARAAGRWRGGCGRREPPSTFRWRWRSSGSDS